jgi:hypothetical protein
MSQDQHRMEPGLSRRSNMDSVTELLLLPDGRILVHNLTPAMAALLREFDLEDNEIALRSSLGTAGNLPGSLVNEPSPRTSRPLAISKARGPERRPKPSTDFQPCVPPSVSKT